ncbi:unnamed protein product [Allacma fusca]|uniref:WAP domain-containing protein n=1 Tax=Allacma fusca TaxID=39272 RepID=A0A8J2J335_9HEXA|nr:unnamed protein product [Allacma fusca]
MADEVLDKGGLYLDELTKRLRVLHPDQHQVTQDLITECEEYLQGAKEFQDMAKDFIELLSTMAETADRERIDVIGKRSRLLMVTSDRQSLHQRLEALVNEKEAHLERLKVYHDSLIRLEADQDEILLRLRKMRRGLIHSMVLYTLYVLITGVIAHHDPDRVCSVKQPGSSQVCISVKFPWKENPVFFCTDYSKINFTPQCIDPNQSHHCYDDGRNDTLKIATPWDCCPLISTPNRCANVECPPMPFNRTCKEIKVLGACCPTYFCDTGEPDNCKTHRLKAACVNPPKNKTNCVAFRDHFGCCNKYQCDGDAKPGFCPSIRTTHHRANVEVKGTIGKAVDNFVTGAKETVNKVTTHVKVPVRNVALMRCAGDHTCPGTMKCCSRFGLERSISRHKVHQESINGVKRTTTHTLKADYYKPNQRNNLVDGVCVETELEGTIYQVTTPSPTQTDKDYNSSPSPPATETFPSSSTTQNTLPKDVSTPPNQVTETISQTNPTITITSESPSLSPTITPTSPAPTTTPSPTTTTPPTTPKVEESTFPVTEPPTVPVTSTSAATAPTSPSPSSAQIRGTSSPSGDDDKNTIVHE